MSFLTDCFDFQGRFSHYPQISLHWSTHTKWPTSHRITNSASLVRWLQIKKNAIYNFYMVICTWSTWPTVPTVQPLSGVLLLKYLIYFYVSVCFASMSVYCVHAVPNKASRGHWIPWNWSYRQLWDDNQWANTTGSLEDLAKLLTLEPSLQTLKHFKIQLLNFMHVSKYMTCLCMSLQRWNRIRPLELRLNFK